MTTLLLITLTTLGPFAWFRSLLSNFVPSPGEGPSEESIEQGFMQLNVFAESSSGQKEQLQCTFSGDPSNKATVFFLVQSSILLLKQLEAKSLAPAGFHTPYTAFGKAYKGEIDGQEVDGITVIDAISQVGCGQNQDTCTDSNKLSTYPVTIVSVTLID